MNRPGAPAAVPHGEIAVSKPAALSPSTTNRVSGGAGTPTILWRSSSENRDIGPPRWSTVAHRNEPSTRT
jgi:hypothetical protein